MNYLINSQYDGLLSIIYCIFCDGSKSCKDCDDDACVASETLVDAYESALTSVVLAIFSSCIISVASK
jgi:hypothetical protein